MLVVAVGIEIRHIPGQHIRHNLSILLRQFQNFIPGVLDGPGFMDAHMPRFCGDHALAVPQHGRDNHRVRLSPAHQKFHLRMFAPARGPDLFPGALTVFVRPVAGQTFKVCLRQTFHDLRMRSRYIVAFKKKHI